MDKKCVHIVRKLNSSDEICAITVPLIEGYARRIGADVNMIGSSRVFPEYPPTYERMQIYSSGRHYNWNICVDTDMLLGPLLVDTTKKVTRDAFGLIMCYSASQSFPVTHRFFSRDKRDLVPVEALVVTSDWTHDLWEPLSGDARANLAAIQNEQQIAEYALAYNMAKYGLKLSGALPAGSQIARVNTDPNQGSTDMDFVKEKLWEWGVT
jgi:hypothetical protein